MPPFFISSGWLITPVIAAAVCFVSLFILQNVFEQEIYRPVRYQISKESVHRIHKTKIALQGQPMKKVNKTKSHF